MKNPLPQIFLSYAWANTNTANAIDNDFKITHGLNRGLWGYHTDDEPF